MKHIFLDFDRTLFDTEAFYDSQEITYIEDVIAGARSADLSRFLYQDTLRFLMGCSRANYACHLVTFGRRSIQECKVRLSSIEPYFTELFYVEQGSKAEIINNYLKSLVSYEKAIFIDDTLGHLEDFVQLVPEGIPARMCRPGAKVSEIEEVRFKSYANLDEVFDILSQE